MTRRLSPPENQLQLGLDDPTMLPRDGFLADYSRLIALTVSEMLKGDPRTRWDVAADLSRLLDDQVTKQMLDAYSSPAKEAHSISVERFIALTLSTGRYDLLRRVFNRIGADVVVGEELVLT